MKLDYVLNLITISETACFYLTLCSTSISYKLHLTVIKFETFTWFVGLAKRHLHRSLTLFLFLSLRASHYFHGKHFEKFIKTKSHTKNWVEISIVLYFYSNIAIAIYAKLLKLYAWLFCRTECGFYFYRSLSELNGT